MVHSLVPAGCRYQVRTKQPIAIARLATQQLPGLSAEQLAQKQALAAVHLQQLEQSNDSALPVKRMYKDSQPLLLELNLPLALPNRAQHKVATGMPYGPNARRNSLHTLAGTDLRITGLSKQQYPTEQAVASAVEAAAQTCTGLEQVFKPIPLSSVHSKESGMARFWILNNVEPVNADAATRLAIWAHLTWGPQGGSVYVDNNLPPVPDGVPTFKWNTGTISAAMLEEHRVLIEPRITYHARPPLDGNMAEQVHELIREAVHGILDYHVQLEAMDVDTALVTPVLRLLEIDSIRLRSGNKQRIEVVLWDPAAANLLSEAGTLTIAHEDQWTLELDAVHADYSGKLKYSLLTTPFQDADTLGSGNHMKQLLDGIAECAEAAFDMSAGYRPENCPPFELSFRDLLTGARIRASDITELNAMRVIGTGRCTALASLQRLDVQEMLRSAPNWGMHVALYDPWSLVYAVLGGFKPCELTGRFTVSYSPSTYTGMKGSAHFSNSMEEAVSVLVAMQHSISYAQARGMHDEERNEALVTIVQEVLPAIQVAAPVVLSPRSRMQAMLASGSQRAANTAAAAVPAGGGGPIRHGGRGEGGNGGRQGGRGRDAPYDAPGRGGRAGRWGGRAGRG